MEVRVGEEVWRGKELRDNIILHGVTRVCSALFCQNLSVDRKDDKTVALCYSVYMYLRSVSRSAYKGAGVSSNLRP